MGNLRGTPLTGSITVQASTNAPANVTGFAGNQTSTLTVFTWNPATGADHYEIRYTDNPQASTWLTSEVLWSGSGTTWTDTTVRSGVYMIVAVSSLATGSVESITPATWQYQPPAYTLSSTVIQDPPGLVIADVANPPIGWQSPTGNLVGPGGAIISIPHQIFQYLGTPAANTTYYAYAYLDASANLGVFPNPSTAPGGLPGTVPNTRDANSAMAAGCVVWQISWVFGGGAYFRGGAINQLK